MANPGLRQQPRTTMGGVTVQTSDVHSGLCEHPSAVLDEIVETMVRLPHETARGWGDRDV